MKRPVLGALAYGALWAASALAFLALIGDLDVLVP
jgi:hypothetical protein